MAKAYFKSRIDGELSARAPLTAVAVLACASIIATAGCGGKGSGKRTASELGAAASAEIDEDCKPDTILGGIRFAEKGDWEGATCREYEKHIAWAEIPIQECAFPGANLQQVYDVIKKLGVGPYLKPELPKTDIEYECRMKCSACESVSYKYISPKHLYIQIVYSGDGVEMCTYTDCSKIVFDGSGNNNITIVEEENSAKLKIETFFDH